MTPSGPILPNFVIAGAVKAGTTALYHYLQQHPDVFMSARKETNFFGYWQDRSDYHEPFPQRAVARITTLEQYRQLFAGAGHETAIGEASPWYLSHPGAPERLQRLLPDARIIIVLREPSERAYSHFGHNVRDGKETYPIEAFERALDDEAQRLADGWHPLLYGYQAMGHYPEQLQRYLGRFERSRLCFVLYDDLKEDMAAVVRRIFGFLEVGASFEPDLSVRYNVTGLPKRRQLHRLIRSTNPLKRGLARLLPAATRRRLKAQLIQRNLGSLPPPPAEVVARLRSHFRGDILRLETMLGRDLGAWLA